MITSRTIAIHALAFVLRDVTGDAQSACGDPAIIGTDVGESGELIYSHPADDAETESNRTMGSESPLAVRWIKHRRDIGRDSVALVSHALIIREENIQGKRYSCGLSFGT